MRGDSTEILFQSFLQEVVVSRYGMGRDVHSLMLFSLPITASSYRQDVLRDSSGEAVVECELPKLCEFPSPDSCQKQLLWTQGSRSCSARNRWSCDPSSRSGEVSPGAWFRKPGSFFFFENQRAGSMFYSHRGGQSGQETCTTRTRL